MSAALDVLATDRTQVIEAELARRERELLEALAVQPDGLPEFCQLLWEEAQPGRPVTWGWYLQALCERLMEFLGSDERVLVVNIPPRTGKSTLISTLLPAWLWLQDSSLQVIAITKALKNVQRDARAQRRVVGSEYYQRLTKLAKVEVTFSADQNQVGYYATEAGGHRISITTGGDITGGGADLLLIDDPHDAEDVLGSPEQIAAGLDYTHDRYETVWERRLNPGDRSGRSLLRTPKVILIMQRLHDRDLAGRRIEAGAATVILPMEAETASRWGRDQRQPGELLVPRALFGAADEAAARANPEVWAGQYQQRPAPKEGGLFKAAHLVRTWSVVPPLRRIVVSADVNFRGGGDPCALGVWGQPVGSVEAYLLDQICESLDYPALREALRSLVARLREQYPGVPLVVLVEAAANGHALVADLRKEVPGIVAVPTGSKSKYERAQVGAVPWFSAGQVVLPDERVYPWVRAYRHELLSFPRAAHDDQVDQTSQALLWLAEHPLDRGEVRLGGERRELAEGPAVSSPSSRPRPGSSGPRGRDLKGRW